MAVLGTETEYGIHAPARPDLHPALLSAAVVDGHVGPATVPVEPGEWAVPLEDPHNRFLGNGARLYVDHAHPEYATPETTSAIAAVTHDLAGDEIVRRAAARASERLGFPIAVFKNNTDGKGAAYGFHENYLVPRSLAWGDLAPALLTHLVTRLPLTGSGRVGLGTAGAEPGYQLSQRADFFEQVTGLETTVRRPLVNTRDEPHADPRLWRRVHVIAGDANLSHTSRLLTAGTTAEVLAGVARLPRLDLADPLAAVRTVSRDLSCAALLRLADGRQMTALDLQEAFCQALAEREGADPTVMALWQQTIDALRTDPASQADRLDWVAKLALLEAYRERDGAGWEAPRLAQVDLQYAHLDPVRGLYPALVRAGRLATLITDDAVRAAEQAAPSDTRAALRGALIANHRGVVDSVDWAVIGLRARDGSRRTLRLPDPLRWPDADAVVAELSR